MDRAALEALIHTSYPGLRQLLKQRTGDSELAADMLNEAVVTAWEHWQAGRVSRPEQFAGYVFRVALNHLNNHRRNTYEQAARRVDPAILEQRPAADDAGETWIVRRLAQAALRQIERLPTERDREIVKRFYLDEHEKEHICRDLHLSPVQFDKIVCRARKRLRALLELEGFRRSDFFVLCLAA